MILGIGIDIVHVDRMRLWMENEKLLLRFFHPAEVSDSRIRGPARALSMAARFAAKEAFGKALGTGMKKLKLTDIQVITDHNGKPDLIVHNTARRALERCGGERIFLSLTHERDNAIAMIVIEG